MTAPASPARRIVTPRCPRTGRHFLGPRLFQAYGCDFRQGPRNGLETNGNYATRKLHPSTAAIVNRYLKDLLTQGPATVTFHRGLVYVNCRIEYNQERNIRATIPRCSGSLQFVVGKDDRIKSRFVDPDDRKRMAVEELISALK